MADAEREGKSLAQGHTESVSEQPGASTVRALSAPRGLSPSRTPVAAPAGKALPSWKQRQPRLPGPGGPIGGSASPLKGRLPLRSCSPLVSSATLEHAPWECACSSSLLTLPSLHPYTHTPPPVQGPRGTRGKTNRPLPVRGGRMQMLQQGQESLHSPRSLPFPQIGRAHV